MVTGEDIRSDEIAAGGPSSAPFFLAGFGLLTLFVLFVIGAGCAVFTHVYIST
jgi:hypothetical protein